MATATVPRGNPPTEAEIRALIESRSARYPTDSIEHRLERALDSAFDTIGYVSLDEQGQYDFGEAFLSDTWGDLRPSEANRLGELIHEARVRAESRARAAIVEEVVAAALAFAAEHPDAPRAKAEPPPGNVTGILEGAPRVAGKAGAS